MAPTCRTAYDEVRHQYPEMILLGTEHSSVGGIRGDYALDPKPRKMVVFPLRQPHDPGRASAQADDDP